jgi:hypothetical protein
MYKHTQRVSSFSPSTLLILLLYIVYSSYIFDKERSAPVHASIFIYMTLHYYLKETPHPTRATYTIENPSRRSFTPRR